MAVFDFAIRPPDQAPPLKQAFVLFGRISSTLCFQTCIVLLFHLVYFRTWSFMASFGLYSAIFHVTTVVDGLVSNSFGRNIQNLRKCGYSDIVILVIMEVNFYSAQLFGYAIVNFVVATDPNVSSLDLLWRRMTAGSGEDLMIMMAKIATNLLLAEVLFIIGHSTMHTNSKLMKLHAFHHCSTFSTWNTNLLFHPLDLCVEFACPALGLLGIHHLVWKDDVAFLVTYLAFLLWYAYDHDETMGLYHVQHHTACDCLYAIYTNVRGSYKHNFLKRYMKDTMDIEWPNKSASGSPIVNKQE